MGKKTKFSLFIIESLKYDDEAERCEGRILSDIFQLSGNPVEYLYIRTRKEFKWAMRRFAKSQMRYLHLSCHGTKTSVKLTLDSLDFCSFGDDIRDYINRRRIFMSACAVVNDALAQVVLPGTGCHSLIGPRKNINFDDAVLTWASFYHLMFRDEGAKGMNHASILNALKNIENTYGVGFGYFKKDTNNESEYIKVNII